MDFCICTGPLVQWSLGQIQIHSSLGLLEDDSSLLPDFAECPQCGVYSAQKAELSSHQVSRNSALSSLTSPSLSRAAHHFGTFGPSIRDDVHGLHSHTMVVRWTP